MYFATGDGANLANGMMPEMFTVPVSKFLGATPVTTTTLDLKFNASEGTRDDVERFDYVRLTIATNTHKTVLNSINDAINNTGRSMILVCDKDNSVFVDSNITDCVITIAQTALYYHKIVNATQVNVIPINTKLKKLTSMTLANITSDDATVTVFLANPTDNWYIIKDVVIPTGATLKLDSDELDYDANLFNLYVKLGGSTPVDVIIR